MESVGEQIRTLRTSRNITQKQLAHVVGVTPYTISAYETNKVTPRYARMRSIADFFHVSVDMFSVKNMRIYNDGRKSAFSSRITERRLEQKLTQLQTAMSMGIQENVYCHYETGIRMPETLEIVNRIAKALDIEYNELKSVWRNPYLQRGKKKK